MESKYALYEIEQRYYSMIDFLNENVTDKEIDNFATLHRLVDKATVYFPESLTRLMCIFAESFINHNAELILVPKTNTYFRLDNINNEVDYKRKLLEYCSRIAYCGAPYAAEWRNKKFRADALNKINQFLATNFTDTDIELIYTELGNGINSPLAERFIKGGYDMEILKDGK